MWKIQTNQEYKNMYLCIYVYYSKYVYGENSELIADIMIYKCQRYYIFFF